MSRVRVEVVYALPTQQWVVELELDAGSTVRDALARVQHAEGFSGLDIQRMTVGIWGRVVDDREHVLIDGDRVELYRPLVMDPMSARRERASVSARRARANASRKRSAGSPRS